MKYKYSQLQILDTNNKILSYHHAQIQRTYGRVQVKEDGKKSALCLDTVPTSSKVRCIFSVAVTRGRLAWVDPELRTSLGHPDLEGGNLRIRVRTLGA